MEEGVLSGDRCYPFNANGKANIQQPTLLSTAGRAVTAIVGLVISRGRGPLLNVGPLVRATVGLRPRGPSLISALRDGCHGRHSRPAAESCCRADGAHQPCYYQASQPGRRPLGVRCESWAPRRLPQAVPVPVTVYSALWAPLNHYEMGMGGAGIINITCQ
jgi:hypothetical protein